LPLTIAERRNFFKEEGLEVEINDFGGGARSLQALVGGSVDVVTGAYEHTIRMQAKGQDVRAVCELGRFPAIVIAVRKEKAGQIKSPADFKGAKIGVTAPGSSTALTAQYAMVKAGLKPTDAAIIGVGAGPSAVAAMKKGEIDVISHLDPVVAKLEADGDIQVLIDTRTEAGTRALFGGSNPAAVLYTRKEFMDRNPVTTQRLVNAFMKTLKWLQSATPEQVADAVPPDYHLGDKPLYLKAVQNSLESYSRDGIIQQQGMTSVYEMLKTLDPELQGTQVNLADTFDDRFVKRATG
jgi:NitT/TauT family transport system substrate-binding protein